MGFERRLQLQARRNIGKLILKLLLQIGLVSDMPGQYTHVQNTNSNSQTSSYRKVSLCQVASMVMKVEIRTVEFWRAVISECLGTMFYVLLGCSSTLFCEDFYDYKYHILMVALSFGFTMSTLVQCFGHISGAHFNPVVSIAMTLTCKVTPLRGCMYCIAQCGGGIAGAALLYGITPLKCHKNLGITVPDHTMTIWQALGLEILLTFLLVFTIFATVDKNRKELGSKSLAIGLALTVCHLAGYRFTGSSMNPARSLGPAFVMNKWSYHWIYWAGPLIGGVISCLLYEYIFDPSRGRRKLPIVDTSPIYPPQPDDTSSPLHSSPSVLTTPTYANNVDQHYGNHVDNHINDHARNTASPVTGLNYGNYPYEEDMGVGNTYAGQSLGRRHYSTCYMPVDTINNGAENHAYSFDSHPRRIPPPPPPRMTRPPEFPPEEILLNDVRVDAYSKG